MKLNNEILELNPTQGQGDIKWLSRHQLGEGLSLAGISETIRLNFCPLRLMSAHTKTPSKPQQYGTEML